jgi:dihydrofolate reductase
MNQIPKAVFSRQGPPILANATTAITQAAPQAGAEGWTQAYVASGDLTEEIAWTKAQEGKPIVAHGGVSFARSLVAGGLVDRFALLVVPVALGQGLPLFSELAAPARLELVSSRAFPGGAVAQTYRAA